MRLTPSDPNIQTLLTQIKNNDIDLQPNFQRGEVWSLVKKRKLIDSILRDWHIPPIHMVVVAKTGLQEVLDGQQRLAAIRDFSLGLFTIDGFTEPPDQEIQELDNLSFKELPPLFRRRFENFSIRVFKLTDYSPGEPGELFYRLNQPTNLTAAEQRNAFFGEARNQVKNLVEKFHSIGLTEEYIGFSNSRMAYDDIIARVCMALELKTLEKKITSFIITAKYRSTEPFSYEIIQKLTYSIDTFSKITKYNKVRFSKANLFSWLIFLSSISYIDINRFDIGEFIVSFEMIRDDVKSNVKQNYIFININDNILYSLISIFNDRSSARVTDALSVILRDFIIWFIFYLY